MIYSHFKYKDEQLYANQKKYLNVENARINDLL